MPGLALHQTAGNEFLLVVGNYGFVEKYKEKLLNLLHPIQLCATVFLRHLQELHWQESFTFWWISRINNLSFIMVVVVVGICS